MDTYADDLAELVEKLDLKSAVHVGHSTGGGEVARYMARHGTSRVAKAVLIGAVPPIMLKTEANPGGLPMEAFDGIRADVLADRSQFFKDLTMPFYGANRQGAKVSQGLRDSFWMQGMMAGFKAAYDCIKAVFGDGLHAGPRKINIPTLIIHGDDDQIVPIGDSAMLSAKLVKGANLRSILGCRMVCVPLIRIWSTRNCWRLSNSGELRILVTMENPWANLARMTAVSPHVAGRPRDYVYRLSFLFESAHGRVHGFEWTRQDTLVCVAGYLHKGEFWYRADFSGHWLCRIRISSQEALITSDLTSASPSGAEAPSYFAAFRHQ